MDDYRFRIADEADRAAIVAFMRTHWDAPHPLIELTDFFDFYYKAPSGKLNFVLCEQDGRLCALAGFVPANSNPRPDIWVSIWVADKTAAGSGLELLNAIPEVTGAHRVACNNIRPRVLPSYAFLGYTTGRVGHFYRLADQPRYRLARITEKDIPAAAGEATLSPLADAAALLASGFAPPADADPCKDLAYIQRRYFAYPRQHYDVYAVRLPGGGTPQALLCTRTVPVPEYDSCVLRIADFIGPPSLLPELGSAIESLMRAAGAEYTECYCAGIDAQQMRRAGFAERQEDDANVIPHYLTPPLLQNIEFYYATTHSEHFTLFRADGDQDRPNIPLPQGGNP